MKYLKDKTVLFYDHGLFISLAERISKDFGKVYYFTPYNSSFPTANSTFIGKGIPGVIRVLNFFDYVDKVDLIIFPDVGDGDIQVYLEKQGKRVFGAKKGEQMELFRDKMKEFMKTLKLDVGKYKVVKGLIALREYLKEHENVWVKINIFRGDFETFKSDNYGQSETALDELQYKLGPKAEETYFIIEDNLDNTVETGMDLYTADGKFPNKCLAGLENKGESYIAIVKDYTDFPKSLTDFNDKISDALKDFKYRAFFSTEIRLNKEKSYMNDFCARLGSPPSELYQNMYENISDIIWSASEGILVDPIIKNKYGAEILMHSTWADKHWMRIDIDPSIREFIKLKNYCIINGQYWKIPRNMDNNGVGAIISTGNTVDEVIMKVKEYSKKVSAYDLEMNLNALDESLEEIKKMEQYGIKLF